MSLKKKVISSLTWVMFLRYTTRGIDIFKYVIITRLLLPSDVGTFLLAITIVLTFEALSDTGFTFAFIQKQVKIPSYAKTLWVISIVRGLLISLVILLTAGIFSWFFKSEELLWLLLVLSIVPLIKGFQSPYVILYQKNLQFQKEFIYRIIPTLVGSLASIILVFIYRSPLSLVSAIVLGAFSETMFSFVITKTTFSYPFSMKKAKELFSYGKYLTAGSVFTLLITQLDSLFVGRFFGTSTLAIYELAFKLANIVFTEITDMISRVAFPFFSQIKSDKHKLKKAFLINITGVTIPAVFVTLTFILFPDTILRLAFGEEYIFGASILQILSIYGLCRAITGPLGPLFLSIGKPEVTTHMSIANFVLLAISLYPLTLLFGLNGVALSMVLSYLLVLPYAFYKLTYAFNYKRT